METKSGDLTIKQASEGKVVATLARLGVRDRDGDVLVAGLLKGGQLVAIKPQHKWDHVDLGVAQVYETAQGTVEAAMEFNMAIPSARDWYEAIKFSHEKKRRQQYSFGFEIEDKSFGQFEGKESRFLKRMECAEVSPVLIGASVGSETLLVKAATPRSWPGGLTPMKSSHQLISAAVTSQRSGLRQLHHVQRLLAKSPMMAKTDEDFDTAMEHFESVLDLLSETSLALVEHAPATVSPEAPKAVVPEPPKAATEDDPDVSIVPTDAVEKGGVPIHDDLEAVMQSIERVTDRLEQVKAKRAEESPRYPNGRPMSTERLGQVDTLMTRLSRLKVSAELTEQQHAEQEELQAMTERLKRLGVTV